MDKGKGKRLIKPRTGHSPAILGKGTAHRVRTKYTRKGKEKVNAIPTDRHSTDTDGV